MLVGRAYLCACADCALRPGHHRHSFRTPFSSLVELEVDALFFHHASLRLAPLAATAHPSLLDATTKTEFGLGQMLPKSLVIHASTSPELLITHSAFGFGPSNENILSHTRNESGTHLDDVPNTTLPSLPVIDLKNFRLIPCFLVCKSVFSLVSTRAPGALTSPPLAKWVWTINERGGLCSGIVLALSFLSSLR